jgi:ATP-binding cassette subfamily B protein
MKYILLTYLKPLAGRITGGFVIKLLASVSELFLPFVLAYIIDNVIPARDHRAIALWGAVMVVLAVAGLLFNIIANRLAAKIGSDATEAMRNDLFAKTLRLSSAQMSDFTKPSVMTRLSSDTYNVHQMIVRMQRLGVRAPILLIGSLIITAALDIRLAGVLLCTIPFIAAVIYFVTKKSIPMYGQLQSALDKAIRIVREDISGIRVIKALSKTDVEQERFGAVNDEMTGREIAVNKTLGVLEPAANLFLNIGLAAVVVVGAYCVNAGVTEIGKILAFMTYFTLIMQALMTVTKIFDLLSRAFASAGRISEVLTTDTDEIFAPSQAVDSAYALEFNHVTFSYGGGEPALNDISFRVKKGKTLGIIGETGSGKSTLVSLLLRFYDADSGEINIGGVNIKSLPIKDLRAKFGVVFQTEPLFEDSIRQNILLGRGVPAGDLRTAVASSGAEELDRKSVV